jgi:hypothetical protein
MFVAVDQVVGAVEGLDAPVTCDDLAELLRARDILDAKLCAGIGEVDAAELWDTADAVSMTGWLRRPLVCTHDHAGRHVARARKLRAMAATRAAWADGRLSSAQVDAICAVVTAERLTAYLDAETDMVDQLTRLDGPDTAAVLRAWAPTALGNLALLCRRHHRRIHRPGTTAHLDTRDATLTIRSADGRTTTSRPRITTGAPAPPP